MSPRVSCQSDFISSYIETVYGGLVLPLRMASKVSTKETPETAQHCLRPLDAKRPGQTRAVPRFNHEIRKYLLREISLDTDVME